MNKLLIIIATLFIAGCGSPWAECEWIDLTVDTVYRETCTNNSSGLLSSTSSKCRVLLSNGKQATLKNPVMDGDELVVCANNPEMRSNIVWFKSQEYRAGISAIGSFPKD